MRLFRLSFIILPLSILYFIFNCNSLSPKEQYIYDNHYIKQKHEIIKISVRIYSYKNIADIKLNNVNQNTKDLLNISKEESIRYESMLISRPTELDRKNILKIRKEIMPLCPEIGQALYDLYIADNIIIRIGEYVNLNDKLNYIREHNKKYLRPNLSDAIISKECEQFPNDFYNKKSDTIHALIFNNSKFCENRLFNISNNMSSIDYFLKLNIKNLYLKD